jgi:hypothetical protein
MHENVHETRFLQFPRAVHHVDILHENLRVPANESDERVSRPV